MKNLYHSVLLTAFFVFGALSTHAQCLDNIHSPFAEDAWLSCQTSINPVPERGAGHWLQYDLGYSYLLDSMFIWNYNVWGSTGNGVKEMAIDYSEDGVNWTHMGNFEIAQAPGSWKYDTPELIEMGNVAARYLSLTFIDSWSNESDCVGISEMKIAVNQPTSTEELLESSLVNIFPNPCSEILNIEINEVNDIHTIHILNALGQVVESYNSTVINRKAINVSTLNDGVYYLLLKSNESLITKRFVKSSE